jgi:conjugative relaxase-like TrwC/TraI family protein
VVADIAKLSVGREAYYTRELATDHQAYLSGHGGSPGRWYGAAATTLGLQGEVSVAGFRQMFEGRHPDTGALLGRSHGRNSVPGFDVVMRPTKSASILDGLGDAATGTVVLAAHHAGVREAVAYLDAHVGTRRGHGGIQHVSGQGLLAVEFDHRTTSRDRVQRPTRWRARVRLTGQKDSNSLYVQLSRARHQTAPVPGGQARNPRPGRDGPA